MMINRQIYYLHKLFKDRVESTSNEQNTDDGIWFYLKPGWRICDNYEHAVHEYDFESAYNALKACTKCDCKDCLEAIKH